MKPDSEETLKHKRGSQREKNCQNVQNDNARPKRNRARGQNDARAVAAYAETIAEVTPISSVNVMASCVRHKPYQ